MQAQINVWGYDLDIEFGYTKGSPATNYEPPEADEIEIYSWNFSDEKQAQLQAEADGESLLYISNNRAFESEIEHKLWELVEQGLFEEDEPWYE